VFAARPSVLLCDEDRALSAALLEQLVELGHAVTVARSCSEAFAVACSEDFDALDETIRIIRKSEGRADAAGKLMKRFELSEEQVSAVLELRKAAKLDNEPSPTSVPGPG